MTILASFGIKNINVFKKEKKEISSQTKLNQ